MPVVAVLQEFNYLRANLFKLLFCEHFVHRLQVFCAVRVRWVFVGNNFASVFGKYVPVVAVLHHTVDFCLIYLGRIDKHVGCIVTCKFGLLLGKLRCDKRLLQTLNLLRLLALCRIYIRIHTNSTCSANTCRYQGNTCHHRGSSLTASYLGQQTWD